MDSKILKQCPFMDVGCFKSPPVTNAWGKQSKVRMRTRITVLSQHPTWGNRKKTCKKTSLTLFPGQSWLMSFQVWTCCVTSIFQFFFGASFWVFGFHSVRSALFWFSHACRWTQRSRARAGRYFWGSVRTLETNAPKGLGISVPRLSKTTRPHKSFQIRTSRLKRVWSHIFLHLLTWSALVFWFIFVSSP